MMYHAVGTQPDPMLIQVTPARLRQHFRLLSRLGLRGVSMRELRAARSSSARLIGLTFDDGYLDFATTAVPILEEFGFSATVFMVAGSIGGTNDWDAGPRRQLMTREQLRAVHRAGHEVGSHGMWHERLVALSPARISEQVAGSRNVLEDVIQAAVPGFCYPHGALDADTVAVVRHEYDYGCAVAARRSDAWAIPRFHVGENDDAMRIIAKLVLRPVRERLRARTT